MDEKTYEDLVNEVEYLGFIVDFLYHALGPANDDVMEMADEAWAKHQSD